MQTSTDGATSIYEQLAEHVLGGMLTLRDIETWVSAGQFEAPGNPPAEEILAAVRARIDASGRHPVALVQGDGADAFLVHPFTGRKIPYPIKKADQEAAIEAFGPGIIADSDKWALEHASKIEEISDQLAQAQAAGTWTHALEQHLAHARRCESVRRANVGPSRVRATATSARPSSARRHNGQRGSGGRPKARASASRSSARSGDSGDDPGPSEPPGDLAGRLCAACSEPLPDFHPNGRKFRAEARFCSAACKQAAHRRRVAGVDESGALDRLPADPYLQRALGEPTWLAPGATCRCNGHHIFDPEARSCFKCGHDYVGRPSWQTPAPYYTAMRRSALPSYDTDVVQVLRAIAREHRAVPRHGSAPAWRGEHGRIAVAA